MMQTADLLWRLVSADLRSQRQATAAVGVRQRETQETRETQGTREAVAALSGPRMWLRETGLDSAPRQYFHSAICWRRNFQQQVHRVGPLLR